jgi:hypothetical protein
MPTFGFNDEETETLLRYFAAIDRKNVPYTFVDRSTLDPTLIKAGEQLTSPDYLQCFSCHVRGNQMPQGEKDGWAPDLAMASQRLYPDWVLEWIHDPQKLLPGTKMPSFYSDPDNQDGRRTSERRRQMQMRALRDYVMSIGPHQRRSPRRIRRPRPRLRDQPARRNQGGLGNATDDCDGSGARARPRWRSRARMTEPR